MKSLQNQYNLIKEGKGNKEIFLKEAKAQFPQYITNVQTFDQVIHSLTEKGIINESVVLVSANKPQTQDWFKIFNENVKAELKETDETVEEMETRGYNYKEKNNNNISTAEMLKGYYVEMKDPKNAEKTEDEIKAIVVKNLEKDPLFYVKDGEFGVRGLGYKSEHPGLPKDIYGNYALGIEPKVKLTGKYKSSGMEPVRLNESLEEDKVPGSNIKKVGDKWRIISGKTGKMWKAHYDTKEDAEAGLKAYFASQNESLEEETDVLSEAKKRAIEKHIKEIEKMGEVAAWEHRIGKIEEKIEELTNKMTVTEGDDVKDMVDKRAVKELKKDIALLTKKKALYEKQKAKAAKKVTDKSAMQSAAGEGATVMEEDATSIPTAAMMLQMADNNPEKFKEYVKQMNADPAFKTQFMRKLSPTEKEELVKKIEAHSETKKESWSGMVRELINKKNLKLK